MIHIIKNCPKHGPLTITQLTTSGRSKSGAIFRCKQCLKISHQKHWERHKEKVKQKQLEYKEKDPEKYREIKRASNKRYAHKYRKASIRNKIYKKLNVEHIRKLERERTIFYVENLPPPYIRDILTRRSSLSAKDIPIDLVEIKRASMLIKRIGLDERRQNRLNQLTEERKNV
jgi:hypothetical protein